MALRSKTEKSVIKELRAKGYIVMHSFKLKRKIYDMYIPDLNMLIEFNGDYWHANPKKYRADYFNVKLEMTAQDIWDRDTEKEKLAKKEGYNYLVIWESDYRKNKNIIIKKIIQKNGRKLLHHTGKRPING